MVGSFGMHPAKTLVERPSRILELKPGGVDRVLKAASEESLLQPLSQMQVSWALGQRYQLIILG